MPLADGNGYLKPGLSLALILVQLEPISNWNDIRVGLRGMQLSHEHAR